MSAIAERLQEMGLELPPRRSAGLYVGAAASGSLVFVSGAIPVAPRGLVTGKVGADIGVPDAQEAARLCVLAGLSALREEIGDLDLVRRVVKLTGFVNSAPGFTAQHVVMDGASRLLVELFAEKGSHARSSVGVAELPLNAAVEVEMTVEVATSGNTGRNAP